MGIKGKRNRKKDRTGNRMAIIGITMVVVSLGVVVNVKCISMRQKNMEYQAREEALQQQYEQEKGRAEELEEYQGYVQTRQYIEKVAKQKLGLVKPDEIVLKPAPKN